MQIELEVDDAKNTDVKPFEETLVKGSTVNGNEFRNPSSNPNTTNPFLDVYSPRPSNVNPFLNSDSNRCVNPFSKILQNVNIPKSDTVIYQSHQSPNTIHRTKKHKVKDLVFQCIDLVSMQGNAKPSHFNLASCSKTERMFEIRNEMETGCVNMVYSL